MRSRLAAVAVLAALQGCSHESLQPSESASREVPPLAEPLGSSIAEAGKVRLFVGQDVTSIADYARDVAPVAGVVSYTSLRALEGVSEQHDSGCGPMFLDDLAATYPRSNISGRSMFG